MLDVAEIRKEFPALSRQLGGRPIVFADNAATSLKPKCVIHAVEHYYTQVCANVHRGVNVLAEEADALYEEARKCVADLIHARPDEIIFVRNTTEAINLAAHMLDLAPEDEVICSLTNHHSNFLPWFTRAKVRLVMPDGEGRTAPGAFEELVTPRTKLIAIGHVSNVTGVIAPVAELIGAAQKRGIRSLVDAAQSVSHMPLDVQKLGCDFLAFSGHKMLGPSGIGVLYARREFLASVKPLFYGGGMVAHVAEDGFDLAPAPARFEAGTPNIEGALGVGAAAAFLMDIGQENVYQHSRQLAAALVSELKTIGRLRAYPQNSAAERLPIVSFAVEGMAADDVAGMLCNRYNIMVRSGVHCAEPLVRRFGEKGVSRISLHLYNTTDEVAYIADCLRTLCKHLA
jgi:cysteine desulfurase/selenocysteine lyase